MNPIKSLLSVLSSSLLFASVAEAKPELNLFAWSEYIPKEVIERFSKETGVAVTYETYSSNEAMRQALRAGTKNYDIIQPSDYMTEILIREKQLAPLDKSKLPLLANIDPAYFKMSYDPGYGYSVPYMIGMVGIVVNTHAIKEPIKGFRDVFQEKYAKRIVVLDDNREIMTWALSSLGYQPNEIDSSTLARAKTVLQKWLPLVKRYDSDSPKAALQSGDVDIGIVWSGEAAILWQEDSLKYAYILPEEGSHRYIDVLAIPAAAKHKEEAHLFIDFMLRPEISKLVSDNFPYTNPNLKARELLSGEQLANPASYPKAGKYQNMRDVGPMAAVIEKMVSDVRAASE